MSFLNNTFYLNNKVTAVVILTLGLWIRYDWDFKHYILELRLYQFWTGVYILIAAASIVMAISFLGCCGAIMENPTVLGLVRTFSFDISLYDCNDSDVLDFKKPLTQLNLKMTFL